MLQRQREAGQLVLYRGIRSDDVIGRGTRLTPLGINRHFFFILFILTHILLLFFFFKQYNIIITNITSTYSICDEINKK